MKKVIFAVLAATMVIGSPALALKKSTAEKYVNASPAVQVDGCEVYDINRFKQYIGANGRTKVKKYANSFEVKIDCPVDGSPFTHQFRFARVRTDQLFGIQGDGTIDYDHPISQEYRDIKGW